MPAFTFEKITPPGRAATAPPDKKRRGVIVQILDRFSLSRGKRINSDAQGAAVPEEPKASV